MRGLEPRLSLKAGLKPRKGPLAQILKCAAFCLALSVLTHTSSSSAAELPASNVLGVVVLSKNATIGGAPLLSGQNLTADDSIEVNDGAAELTTSDGTQLILGHNTQISLAREGRGTAVVLDHGNLTFAQTDAGQGLSIRTGNVSVSAQPSAKTRALMTLTSQSLLIATREGSVLVDRDGQPGDGTDGRGGAL